MDDEPEGETRIVDYYGDIAKLRSYLKDPEKGYIEIEQEVFINDKGVVEYKDPETFQSDGSDFKRL